MPGRFLDVNRLIISPSTEVYGVIGDPIDHSLSPLIQNAAFRSEGLDAVFLAFPVRREALRSAIEGMRSLSIVGFNVTTPHKSATLRYLDEVETRAAELRSINTVTNEDQTLTGFNTDGLGAVNAMKHAGIKLGGHTILLLGAGGAARAIGHALAEQGCSLKLMNRSVHKAKRLATSLHTKFGVKAESYSLSDKSVHECNQQTDVILNASSMGMDGKANPPINRKWIRKDQWVFDIVYRPIRTKLLRDAAGAGASTIDGLDMLVHQGACSFTIWTGRKAPLEAMRQAVAKRLGTR